MDGARRGVADPVAEDDPLVRDLVQGALADGGFQTEIAEFAEEAIKHLQGNTSECRAGPTDKVPST